MCIFSFCNALIVISILFQEQETIEREKVEKKEVAEIRKKMVHKANKIGEYKKQEYEDIAS